jgi:hypothetical protein
VSRDYSIGTPGALDGELKEYGSLRSGQVANTCKTQIGKRDSQRWFTVMLYLEKLERSQQIVVDAIKWDLSINNAPNVN